MTNEQIVNTFLNGGTFQRRYKALSTNGNALFSYNLKIAEHNSDSRTASFPFPIGRPRQLWEREKTERKKETKKETNAERRKERKKERKKERQREIIDYSRTRRRQKRQRKTNHAET